jgi:hypothetical protein
MAGHALYDQNLPVNLTFTPLSTSRVVNPNLAFLVSKRALLKEDKR